MCSNGDTMKLDVEKESVRAHLNMLQGIISRMAANSANCKTWCVTLVSAILILVIDKNKPQAILVGFIPIALFFLLDAYYLSLERDFRDLYNTFVQKIHKGQATEKDLYLFKPKAGFKHRAGAILSAMFGSLAVLPFYGVLAATLFIVKKWVVQS
jgi:hypothetical protein